ncbi:MAG TPA: RNA polymerase sigma factor [Chloroflexia bacterium]|nr:RNA polymerase sigma factor [Chloroflexia bacterium]
MTWHLAPVPPAPIPLAPSNSWVPSFGTLRVGASQTTEGNHNQVWDEATWIELAKQGDEAGFAAIYERYERPIYALVYRLMGNPDDAFDITQEVFVKAYKALAKTTPDVNLSAWLHRIASNACMDVLRRRKIVRWLPWDPGEHANITPSSPSDEPERTVLGKETRLQVQAVLNQMNERYRLCLVLREYQDLSCEEIAEITGTSRQAVKSTLFRAREQFREIYERLEATGNFNQTKSKDKKGGRR